MMKTRLDFLTAFMAQHNLDAFLVTHAQNRHYLSGFSGSSGALLLTRDQPYLVTDFRYYQQSASQAPNWQLYKQKTSLQQAVNDLLNEVKPARLGFEANSLTVADWQTYCEKGPKATQWVPSKDLILKRRASKTEAEIESVRQAQRITDQAGTQLPHLIEPGKSEKQVAWELEKVMRDLGADGLAFDVIVASGPNSALPHYHAGDRIIGKNEIVLVDFGAKLAHYHSDMTRTFFTGEPTAKYHEVYHIVLEALHKAEETLKAGFGLKAGDAIARNLIKEAGYGEQFGHSLGHGLGLHIHEEPKLSFRAKEDELLAVNQLVTIEPGIYIEGWGGIRIEDLVRITQDGVDILTTTSKHVDLWRKGRV